MWKLTIIGVTIAALSACIALAQSATAPQRAAVPGFAGKIALVVTSMEGKHAYVTDSRVEQLGGKSFLVGQGIDPISGKPLKGSTTWVSIEHVLQITVFDSHEALAEQLDVRRVKVKQVPK